MAYWDIFRIERPGPAYLGLCEAIGDAIRAGKLPAGKRLPSHRLLARKLGLSIGTVTHAYEEAVRRGLIVGKVGKGSFVSHFVTWEFSVVDSLRIPEGCLDLYQNLPVAIPEVEGPAWEEAIGAIRSRTDLAGIARMSWSETSERRERAGADWIGRLGLRVPHRQIVDCPGVLSALGAILSAVTRPHDLVLAGVLSHASVRMLADNHSLRIKGLPLDEEGIVPAALEEECAREPVRLLYCAPTLHSPTAATMSEARRREIASIAERHDVMIVEDESAAFLTGDTPPPIASFAPHRTFLIAETWMALSLGLRTAYVFVPEAAKQPFARALAAGAGTAVSLLAEVAAEWIGGGAADRLIEARRAALRPRNAIARRAFTGRRLASHEHGHHVWLALDKGMRSDLLVRQAIAAGIAVHAPDWFVVDAGPWPDGVRISVGNAPDLETLARALERVEALIREASG